jgi:hypothetical protein
MYFIQVSLYTFRAVYTHHQELVYNVVQWSECLTVFVPW